MKLRHWFFLFLIKVGFVANAQSIEQTIQFAQEQTEFGNYESAVKSWQRAAYFAPDSLKEMVFSNLAPLYFLVGKPDESVKYFDRLYYAAQSDSTKNEAIFGKVQVLIVARAFNDALIELYALDDDLSLNFQNRKHFFLGTAHYGLKNFEESKMHFETILKKSENREMLSAFYEKAEKYNRKSPKTARRLSMIFPGAGQFYAGDLKNGFNSMILNVGLLGWFFGYAQAYTTLDATFTIGPWFYRYYLGGFQRAGNLVTTKKEERLNLLFLEILDTLQ